MLFQLPESVIPVNWLRNNDYYFFQNEIQEYRKGKVYVKGFGEMIMMSSYSYLGLLGHPEIEKAAAEAISLFGTGTHGVRLLAGTTSLHLQLEEAVCEFKKAESAVTFSSGYVANCSGISALLRPGDYVISDALNHASIIDGCYLSRANTMTFKHNDIKDLEVKLKSLKINTNKFVVADAVFSMDGDIFNLPEASRICKKYGALLMIDEAHSLGVLGSTGCGIEEYFGMAMDAVDIKMGTFSKTIPSIGGYIASRSDITDLIHHNGRGYVYSAALPPAQVAAAMKALEIIQKEKWRIDKLRENFDYFRSEINRCGFDTMKSSTAIVPVLCYDNEKAFRMAKHCQDKGIFVQAIISPVVPRGRARLRCIVTADHSQEELEYVVSVIREAGIANHII